MGQIVVTFSEYLQEQFHVQNLQMNDNEFPLFSLIEEIMPQSHEKIPVTFYRSLL